jgi:beta-mannosidase
MSHIPSTFAPLNEGWTLTAVNPEAAPEALRATLAAGIPATVPGEATLDLLNAGLIDDPFDGDNENKQMSIGDSPAVSIGRMTAPTVTTWWPTASTPSPTSH